MQRTPGRTLGLTLALSVSLNPAFGQVGSEPKTNSGGISGDPGIIRNNTPTIGAGGAGTFAPKPALTLSSADRQAIRDAVLAEDTRQATPAGFQPEVGKEVPSKINVHAFPRPLVYNLPPLKQYMYANLDRNALIIDPMSKQVVEVIAYPETMVRQSNPASESAVAVIAGLPDLKGDERRAVYLALDQATAAQPVPDQALLAGSAIAPSLRLQPVPAELTARFPQFPGMQFAKLADGRIIVVDPAKREVVGILTQDDGRKTAAQEGDSKTAAQKSGGADAQGSGQAPGAHAAESVQGGGTTGSGGSSQ